MTQLEIMARPPEERGQGTDLAALAAQAAHFEQPRGRGGRANWAVLTKRVVRRRTTSTGLECVRVEWVGGKMQEVRRQRVHACKADLILLAMGFVGPRKQGLLDQAGLTLDARGNVAANTEDYATSDPQIFACGDMRRGQSLVVWAIREGRQAARAVDAALMGVSELPR